MDIAISNRSDRGDADAHRHSLERARRFVCDVQLLNCTAHALRNLRGLLPIDVVEDCREFLAAVTRQDIERSRCEGLYGLRDTAQCLITGLMSVAVGVRFEVIDVDEQDCERPTVRAGVRPEAGEMVIEHTAVFRPGQCIVFCKIGIDPGFEKRGA